jgi:transmembrane sensor
MSKLDPPNEGGLLEEAAAWFARMRGPDAEASRADFEAWLARGALHRAAYNRASEIFAMGKFLADEDLATGANAPWIGRSRPVLVAAFAAVLLVVATSWLAIRTMSPARQDGRAGDRPSSIQVAQLRAAGEARSLRLPDGSLVRLAADTILDVRFSGSERRSLLERGLALFQVAHEERPFVVAAGGGSVTAHGTVFEVGLSADRRVSVRLIEGVIDVRLPADGDRKREGPVKRLHGAGAIVFMAGAERADGAPATAPSRAPAAAAATSQDPRDFDAVRLADLLAMANRNSSRPIRIADPALGDARISGRFRTDDADLLSERIALLLGLVVDRSDPAAIILRRK